MSPLSIGSAVGAAAITIGRGALGAVGNGLSFAAELAKATSGATSESPPSQSESAKRELDARIAELQERIRRQLAAAGIDVTQPVELVSNRRGGIEVAGPHPQQAAIAEALSSDILLERDFNQLASDYADLAGQASDLTPSLTLVVGPRSQQP